MKKLILFIQVLMLGLSVNAQILRGTEAMLQIPGSELIRTDDHSIVPLHVVYANNQKPLFREPEQMLREQFRLPVSFGLQILSVEEDLKGMKHYRYRALSDNKPVIGSMYIFHTELGRIKSMNGFIPKKVETGVNPVVQRDEALNKALKFVGAVSYKWQFRQEEEWLKAEQRNPNATFYPDGRLVYAPKTLQGRENEYALAWEFDIYAHEPISRKQVYVDAINGEIIHSNDLLQHVDATGTAVTGYVGTKTITTDFTGSTYRLRESGRGQGIETYNMQKGTSYSAAVDFTDSDNYWNNVNANLDQYATDAHYGAEMTYDYFYLTYGRNSINNAGLKLLSYVHYSTNYVNAFWDGTRMTYGDGNSTYSPLTSLDICGHEITHGLTSYTANLVYSYQSGALNESFSDIFGTVIEFYAHPATADWLIGEDIGAAFRSMSNPNAYSDPDTYLGTYWYTGSGDNGGVHINSGVQNYWFYLLTVGGSGTNDIGNAFNVSGIGMTKAAAIAYRTLTVYLTPTSQYADARYYSIQAAQDLYGACSPEVIATTNAWYAVGVGAAFSSTVSADFSASVTSSCSVPFTVSFTNTSTNADAALWSFGDGGSSTQLNPTYTYQNPGTYTVTLTASSSCGSNTNTKTNYIIINVPAAPSVTGASACSPGSVTLSASGSGNLFWYDQPSGGNLLATGTSFATPFLNTTTTYYVENRVAQSNQNVGPASYSFGSGGMHNNATAQYLIFNVLQPCTLVSVLVNSGAAGTRNVILWNSQGQVLQTIPVNFASGVQTITLNLPLTPGNAYRLGGSSMNLYRNTTGAAYPYTAAGLISITGASAGSSYYYYFYNWLVQPAPCVSVRTPVTASISTSSASFASPPAVCAYSPAFNLSGGSPAGGTYSGTGVSNNQFDPSVGAGNYTLTYTITDEFGCVRSATATQTVHALPTVNAGSYSPVCVDYPPVQLSGTPAGGVFSGTGVSANQFNPSAGAGNYTINYAYTDQNGCSNTASASITVHGLPQVSAGNYGNVCNTSVPVTLTGNPAGGTFTGQGVSNNQFNPSIGPGTYTISYQFTDANGCSNTDQTTITVIDCSCNPPGQPGAITQSGSPSKVCPGEIRNYTVPPVAGVSYNWTVPAGATILSGQGLNSISVLFDNQLPATSSISVVAQNNCGTSTPSTRTISKNVPSVPSVISGPAAGVCNSQQVYSVTPVSGVTYNWWFDNSTGASVISGQGSAAITAGFLNNFTSTTLRVTANNLCGASNARSLTVKGAPATPPAVTGPSGVCINQQGVPYSSGTVASAVNYTWTVPSGARINDGTVTSSSSTLTTTATSVTVNWKTTAGKVSVKANNACGSSSTSSLTVSFVCREQEYIQQPQLSITVNPNPVHNRLVHFYVTTSNEGWHRLKLTDLAGRILINDNMNLAEGEHEMRLNVENLVKGIYFITIEAEQGRRTARLVVE